MVRFIAGTSLTGQKERGGGKGISIEVKKNPFCVIKERVPRRRESNKLICIGRIETTAVFCG